MVVITTESESAAASEPLNDLTTACVVYIKEPKTRRNFVVFCYSKGGNDKFYSSTGTVTFVKSKDIVIREVLFLQCKTTDYKSHV